METRRSRSRLRSKEPTGNGDGGRRPTSGIRARDKGRSRSRERVRSRSRHSRQGSRSPLGLERWNRDRERRHTRERLQAGRTTHSSLGRSQGESLSLWQISNAITKGIDKVVSNSNTFNERRQVSLSTSVLNNIISDFDPLKNDVSDWVNAVDEFAQIYGWNDGTTCHLALNKLKGPAEIWFRGLPTRLFTWIEWKQMLIKNFKPKRDLNKALQDMMKCKPTGKQLLYEYVFSKLALIHKLKLPLTGEDQVNLIMGGIEDKQVKFAVDAAGIKEPHVLANHFRVLELGTVSTNISTTENKSGNEAQSGSGNSSAKIKPIF